VSTLVELLVNRARHSPQAIAVGVLEFGDAEPSVPDWRVYSYGELDARANAIAASLKEKAQPGERALLLYRPGAEFLCGFFGCLYAGVVAVPTHPPRRNRPDARLRGIALDSGARVALTTSEITADGGIRFRHTPELAPLEWLATDALADARAGGLAPDFGTSETIAFLQYTSGSTGTPKGVIVTHGNLLHTLDDLDRGFAHDAESIMVSWLPTFHDLGLIYGALLPVYVGFPSYLMAPAAFLQRPARWLEAISCLRGTHTAAPNFAFDLCVNSIPPEQRARLDLRSLRCALNAAETVRPETIRRFNEAFAPAGLQAAAMRPGYGLAEVTLKVSTAPLGAPLRELRVSAADLAQHRVTPLAEESDDPAAVIVGCGISHVGARLEIVDPDRCVRVDDGRVGEVWVAGKSVAQGYLGRDEESEGTFRAQLLDDPAGDCFLRTGDLGFMREGELFICGRCKEVIIIRGLNHYPQDIEVTTQQAHPALRANGGAAFSVEEAGEDRLVIVQEVERTSVRNLNAEEIAAAVRAAVAEEHQLQVHALVLVKPGAVPKTSSGKIQRIGAKAEFESGGIEDAIAVWRAPVLTGGVAVSRSAGAPAKREVEDWLLDFCAARFGVERSTLSPAEPLARYGMDSLAAVDLARELAGWLDRHVEVGAVFDYPSIGALAAHFGAHDAAASASRAGARAGRRTEEQNIAIVGLGGHFPGAANPAAYWELLCAGKSGVVSMPHDRPGANAFYAQAKETGLPQITQGGFLESVDLFDAAFFGISPREAEALDPQQRLLLEVSWEALEDAGLSPDELTGSDTGVFIGLSTNDYGRLFSAVPDEYAGTGNAFSMAANRLSYFYDWHGPSVSLDTACSSSLVALHQACASLRAGECGLALAGGVNLILTPHWSVSFAHAGMLAPDGRCKTFDARADGYVRGEGCGLVVLQRLEDALKAPHPVLAIVRGSAINQDGRTNGLTAPNGRRQRDVISRALAAAGVTPGEISYVETHGTGTQLGDPIELEALRDVLCAERPPDRPLRIGSVKTNIGHLEAAAGIAGLIKLVLALKHRALPPHLNFSELNAKISGDAIFPLISRQLEAWESGAGRRTAAVSSFGFGGTNAHVVLEEAATPPAPAVDSDDGPLVLALSAKSAEALREMARDYERALDRLPEVPALARAACARRAQLEHRAAIVAETPEALRRALRGVAGTMRLEEEPDAFVALGHVHRAPRVAFLFTGQGSLYPCVARVLYETQPVFREALERCALTLDRDLPVPLIALLQEEAHGAKLQQTLCAQPVLFALAHALVALWRSWGIAPDAVLGHSAGEYAAACAAGAFDVETGLRMIMERARRMQALPAGGGMAAVFGPAPQVAEVIFEFGTDLSVAALNGPGETVISGRNEVVEAACRRFEATGMRAQRLAVSHAFHSALMEPMLPGFTEFLGTQALGSPELLFVSNVTGSTESRRLASPTYWAEHVRKPVLFGSGMAELHRLGCRTFVEIGPQPVLISLARRALAEPSLTCAASLRWGRPDRRQMAEAAAALFASGVRISWRGVHQGAVEAPGALPSYPFQRKRYWLPQAEGQAWNGTPAMLPATALPEVPSFGADLAALPPADRLGRLREFLGNELRQALKLPPGEAVDPEQGFWDMGMDSMMAVQLRERVQRALGRELPATLAFAYSTLEELAEHLANAPAPEAARADEPARESVEVSGSEIAHLIVPNMSDSVPERSEPNFAPDSPQSPLSQAYAVIERLERELAAARVPAAEPIAVVGMGCRFPGGGSSPELYWRALSAGVDAVGPIPADRWSLDDCYDPDRNAAGKIYTRFGSFLGDVSGFDAEFFGVSPREAVSLDPQQRLLLEVTWETLEHAGMAPASLRQSRTGIFVGVGQNDYARLRLHAGDLERITRFDGTGNGFCFAAGRLSHTFGLRGPSVAVDCACSSSLVAVHLACQSLRSNECDLALAAGAQLILSPEVTVFLCRAGALSTDGRCKAFDAAADGFGRGEGAGAVALKRLSDAKADGDRIWAVIRGSAVNHDGPSTGLTVPSARAQAELLQRALAVARLEPQEVSVIEAHGTGTQLGDPIEAEALASVYARNQRETPLWLCSAKTNHGHLEAAAGVAGLIKTILSLHHCQLPPHLHLQHPSPHILWDRLPFRIPTELTEWSNGKGPRVAGVSSFGFGGTNAHVLMEEAPERAETWVPGGRSLLVLSARTPAALRELASRHANHWEEDRAMEIANACHTAALGRNHFAHRIALLAEARESVCAALRGFARGELPPGVWSGSVPTAPVAVSAAATLEQVGASYVRGDRIDWRKWFPHKRRPVVLPTYPFERQRFWIEKAEAPVVMGRPADVETFDVAWAPCDRREPRGEREVRTWVVLCDETGVGDAISAELRGRGGDCIRVWRGAELARRKCGDWSIALGDAEPFAGLVRELGTRSSLGVVHCWSLDAAEAALWPAAREVGCGSTLQLFQALRRGGFAAAPRLWLLTRASVPVGEGVARGGLAGAMTRGLARALALESPENWGGLHDLPQKPDAVDIRNLVEELLQPSLDEAAWRGGRAWAPKLRRRAVTPAAPLVIRQDGTYWVTGGWGALGLRVAQLLADRGAGLIVLSARRAPNAQAQAFAKSCASRGVKVWLRRSDCADTGATLELAREIERGAFPLRGVFHAAGEGGRLPADELGVHDLERVCRAKVEGAWNLHEATRETVLDHFVLFSSVAATWGAKQQAHYGAANHFLDTFACWRRRQGLPSLSIAWGPWAGGGLADPEARRALERMGLFPMAPEAALHAMEELLAAGDVANAVVVHADWQRFPALFSALPRHRFFTEVAAAAPARSATSPPGRMDTIQPRLANIVAGLLGHPADYRLNPRAGFSDLGMDSVMSLELRNCIEREFGLRLSATVAFDHPNLVRLTHHLTGAIGSAALDEPGDVHAPPEDQETIERRIHGRLEELEELLKPT
jgi:acyl transferase domain-containing protein/acyl-CoA synthetase (AMP-forming)/AMP-acid ligase II